MSRRLASTKALAEEVQFMRFVNEHPKRQATPAAMDSITARLFPRA